MRILIASYHYAPSIGGQEKFSEMMARALAAAGDAVEVASFTPGEPSVDGVPVLRRPGFGALRRAAARADVVWQNGLSTQLGLPVLTTRTPLAISHIIAPWPVRGPSRFVRNALIRRGRQIAVSAYIAGLVPAPSVVIPNSFDAERFAPWFDREDGRAGAAFVGRLVSDKGADRLLRAWARTAAHARGERLTVIGDGPERPGLAALAASLGVDGTVEFAGPLRGAALAERMAGHRALVVPSVWQEPFGIVALEGLAAGCRTLVARRGGLPEAVGAAGSVFEPEDAAETARAIDAALEAGPWTSEEREGVRAHLDAHHPDRIAARYRQEFERLRTGGTG